MAMDANPTAVAAAVSAALGNATSPGSQPGSASSQSTGAASSLPGSQPGSANSQTAGAVCPGLQPGSASSQSAGAASSLPGSPAGSASSQSAGAASALKGSPANPPGRGTLGNPEDDWSITMGSGTTVNWPAPPGTVRKLLKELFSAQPEEPLAWVHHVVWQLHAEEVALMLGSSGGQASSSAGAFEGPSTQLQLPYVVSNSHTASQRMSSAPQQEFSNVTEENALSENALQRDPSRARLCSMNFQEGRASEWWSGGSPCNFRGGSQMSQLQSPVWGAQKKMTMEWRNQTIKEDETELDEHFQRLTHRLMNEPTNALCSHNTHSARLSHAMFSPRPSNISPRPSVLLSTPGAAPAARRTSSLSVTTERDMAREMSSSGGLLNLGFMYPHGKSSIAGNLGKGSSESLDAQVDVTSQTSTKTCQSPGSKISKIKEEDTVKELQVLVPNFPENEQPRRPPENDQLRRGSKRSRADSVMSDGMWIHHFTGSAEDLQNVSRVGSTDTATKIIRLSSSLCSHCHAVTQWVAASSVTLNRMIWELIWLVCVLHELWMVPFELMFLPNSDITELSTLKLVVLICFLADMVVNFLVGYVESDYFVVESKRIVDHYLRTWFLLDFCIIVSDIILLVYGNKVQALKFPKLLRAVRLYRAWTSAQFILRLCGHRLCCRLLVHAGRLNLVLLLLAHAHAVAWAALQPDAWKAGSSEEAYDRYLESLWWAYSAVTFGCAAPVSSQGQWLLGILIAAERETLLVSVIFYLVRCVMIHGYTDLDEDYIQDEILGFLKTRKIPAMARQQVLANVHQVCKARKLQNSYDALAGQALPLQIRTSVASLLWRPKLCSLGLVKELMNYHSQFATELTLTILGEFLPSHTVLYEKTEASHIAYYVISGVLEVTHADDHHQPTDDYIAGMWAGEKAVVNFELRRGETVTCKTLAELMVLSAMEFRRLLTRFELVGIFEDLIKVHLWLGFCGRCGLFGDHFSRDCPYLQLLRKNQGFFRTPLSKRENALKMASRNPVGKDLRVFLQEHGLEHLLGPMYNHRIMCLVDLTRDKIDELSQDPDVALKPEDLVKLRKEIKSFRKRHAQGATRILANTGSNDNYLAFISHYKVEAGTEATLMQNDILQLIAEDPGLPGHDLESPVFLDTEDLNDLGLLKQHVKRSHNLILLLTNGVLKRPWVLLEIVTAVKSEVTVLPVEIQRPDLKFTYPDEGYYQKLLAGQELDDSATQLLKEEGVELEDLCSSLRQVFKRIALPFSPHKTATIRKAELQDILKRCRIKRGRASFSNDPSTMMAVCRQASLSTPSPAVSRQPTQSHAQQKAHNTWAGIRKAVTGGKAQGVNAVQFSDALSNVLVKHTKTDLSASAKRARQDKAEKGLRRVFNSDSYESHGSDVGPTLSDRPPGESIEPSDYPGLLQRVRSNSSEFDLVQYGEASPHTGEQLEPRMRGGELASASPFGFLPEVKEEASMQVAVTDGDSTA